MCPTIITTTNMFHVQTANIFRHSRPESKPSLAFERFSNEGNSEDAVVYLENEELLAYKGKHYRVHSACPIQPRIHKNANILDVFLEDYGYMIVQFEVKTMKHELACPVFFYPDPEQRAKLCAMFNRHGSQLKEAAEQVMQAIKRVKTIVDEHTNELNDIHPRLDLKELHISKYGVPYFPFVAYDSDYTEKLERRTNYILTDAEYLENIKEISRKRKVQETDGDEETIP